MAQKKNPSHIWEKREVSRDNGVDVTAAAIVPGEI